MSNKSYNGKSVLLSASFFGLLFGTVPASALPSEPIGDGWTYYAALHQAGFYNNVEIWRQDDPYKDWWSDSYLTKVTNARYDAIDRPMIDFITNGLTAVADDNGIKIIHKSVRTEGILNIAFEPAVANNTLDFHISGVGLKTYVRAEKSWYAEGFIKLDISNITIQGEYDYYNGVVNITHFDAPVKVDVDLDFPVAILGGLIDPIVDGVVDKLLTNRVPSNLNVLFEGKSPSLSVIGVKDYVPLGTLMHEGIDYGMVIRDALSEDSLINDNFSVAIGNITTSNQRLEITIGNATYKRWTTGGRKPCYVEEDDNCL